MPVEIEGEEEAEEAAAEAGGSTAGGGGGKRPKGPQYAGDVATVTGAGAG